MVAVASMLLSAVLAGGAAVFVSAAIERWGGTVGGVMGSMPTTIVAFSIGLAAAAREAAAADDLTAGGEAVSDALSVVPVGMFIDALFLLLWRELPRTRLLRSQSSHPRRQLATMIVLTMSFWLVAATIVVLALQAMLQAGVPAGTVGVAFFLLSLLLGLAALFMRHVPSPSGSRPVSRLMYLARGLLAGVAIGVAVILSDVSPLAAGLASAFPAIFLTTMVALWTSQGGEAVPSGATGPMMLGSLAVSAYALTFGALEPALATRISNGAGAIVLAAVISDVVAITCISLPVYRLLEWRKHSLEAQQALETEGDQELALRSGAPASLHSEEVHVEGMKLSEFLLADERAQDHSDAADLQAYMDRAEEGAEDGVAEPSRTGRMHEVNGVGYAHVDSADVDGSA